MEGEDSQTLTTEILLREGCCGGWWDSRVILTTCSVDRKRVIFFLVKGGRESHFGEAPCSQIDWGRERCS